MKSILLQLFKTSLPAAAVLGLLLTGSQLLQTTASAADEVFTTGGKKTALPADEQKAWAEVKRVAELPPPPSDWNTNRPSRETLQAFMAKQAELAAASAQKATEFLSRFPNSEHAAEARKLQVRLLTTASGSGKKEQQEALTKAITAAASDRSLPEGDRVDYRLQMLRMDVGKAARGNPEDGKKNFINGLVALSREFPTNEKLYSQILSLAMNEEGDSQKKLAQHVAASADAPQKFKKKAQDLLDGKIFKAADQVGKPVDIKYTAVDGREVDLGKMKGKVVLVDFWAVWCGPCVKEVPHVKETYEKYHDKGFEIVGISFDTDKDRLLKFIKEKGMTWPQYFDGKTLDNEFGQQFNVRAIPEMWLIDKKGNLAEANARNDLAGKVAKLLEEK